MSCLSLAGLFLSYYMVIAVSDTLAVKRYVPSCVPNSVLFCLVSYCEIIKSRVEFFPFSSKTNKLNGFILLIDVTRPESFTGNKITWIIKARGRACFMFNWSFLKQRCYVDLFHGDPVDILRNTCPVALMRWDTWGLFSLLI